MSDTRVMLVVGATGAAASRIFERGSTASGTGVVGLSRNRPERSGAWLTADLNNGRRLSEVLATRPDITHIVYASRAPHGETGVENVPGNLGMLRNLVDSAEASLPRLAVALLCGACLGL